MLATLILAVLVPGIPIEEQPHVEWPPPWVLVAEELRAAYDEAVQSAQEAVREAEALARDEATLTGDALAVAACESGERLSDGSARLGTHRWEGVNGDRGGHPPRSSASGAFQFLDSTWAWTWRDLIGEPAPTARAMHATPGQQRRAFDALWDGRRGSSHWNPSASCWRRMLG